MLKAFTRNYEDNSTEAGFQFTFYCDLCHDGYKTSFVESETYKKGAILRSVSGGARALSGLFGGRLGDMAYNAGFGSDILSERFNGMSPEWQKEHEKAFERAQNEAQRHFHRCHKCRLWVCDADFNEDEGLCVECAPRMNVEVSAARAKKMVDDIREKAEETKVFDGEIESKTILCPTCGKPCGVGKFCNNCGENLSMKRCPSCGTSVAQGVKFCGECGTRIG
ncbi:MAG: zinc ribbon domain-containing protein [Parabacteroides sp.]|nr:zinc ribbon domain-containing protein [Parabacteroides sp.]